MSVHLLNSSISRSLWYFPAHLGWPTRMSYQAHQHIYLYTAIYPLLFPSYSMTWRRTARYILSLTSPIQLLFVLRAVATSLAFCILCSIILRPLYPTLFLSPLSCKLWRSLYPTFFISPSSCELWRSIYPTLFCDPSSCELWWPCYPILFFFSLSWELWQSL